MVRAERVGCSSRCTDSIRYDVLYTSFDQRYSLSSFIDAMVPKCFHRVVLAFAKERYR